MKSFGGHTSEFGLVLGYIIFLSWRLSVVCNLNALKQGWDGQELRAEEGKVWTQRFNDRQQVGSHHSLSLGLSGEGWLSATRGLVASLLGITQATAAFLLMHQLLQVLHNIRFSLHMRLLVPCYPSSISVRIIFYRYLQSLEWES